VVSDDPFYRKFEELFWPKTEPVFWEKGFSEKFIVNCLASEFRR